MEIRMMCSEARYGRTLSGCVDGNGIKQRTVSDDIAAPYLGAWMETGV